MRLPVESVAPSPASPPLRLRPSIQRVYERYSLDDAFGHLIFKGSMIPCQFIDISIGGCRARMETPFAPGALAQVEVVLLTFGLVLRIGGITEWTHDCDLGVRFTLPSAHSKNQLASLITCLMDKDAAKAVQETFGKAALDQGSKSILVAQAVAEEHSRPAADDAAVSSGSGESPVSVPQQAPEPMDGAGESGPLLAVEDEWPALIRFLHERTHAEGFITGLSLDACTIRTAAALPGTLHSRVELSFQIRGLPFQLQGAVANCCDKRTARVCFHDLSRRKREELEQVLDELREAAKKKM